MKKAFFKKIQRAALLTSLLAMGSFAHASGGIDSGGGDYIRAKFLMRGQKIVPLLSTSVLGKQIISQNNIDLELLKNTLSVQRILVTEQELKDRSGSLVDAFTQDHVISLNLDRWTALFISNNNIDFLILHEMLRSAGYDDEEYRISFSIKNENVDLYTDVFRDRNVQLGIEQFAGTYYLQKNPGNFDKSTAGDMSGRDADSGCVLLYHIEPHYEVKVGYNEEKGVYENMPAEKLPSRFYISGGFPVRLKLGLNYYPNHSFAVETMIENNVLTLQDLYINMGIPKLSFILGLGEKRNKTTVSLNGNLLHVFVEEMDLPKTHKFRVWRSCYYQKK